MRRPASICWGWVVQLSRSSLIRIAAVLRMLGGGVFGALLLEVGFRADRLVVERPPRP